MRTLAFLILGSLGPLLTACGGAGDSVASLPAPSNQPVTFTHETVVGNPLPATPALTSGTYDVFGVAATAASTSGLGPFSIRSLNATDLHITVDAATNSYTIIFDPAVFHVLDANGVSLSTIGFKIDDPTYGHSYTTTHYGSDGSVGVVSGKGDAGSATQPITNPGPPPHRENSAFYSTTGGSYVSLAEWQTDWNWSHYDNGASDVIFAYGHRSAPSEVPVSGTATYQSIKMIGAFNDTNLTLTADFGGRSIGADMLERFCSCGEVASDGDFLRTRTLSGSGSIDNQGAFGIALKGTETKAFSATTESSPIAGTLGGAFFGPDASQIGGYYQLASDIPAGFIAARTGP
jgi:hypothetical protein